MKQCCEYIRGLRYKLRMMGIPCEGPTYIFGDNQSVLANTSNPDSMLKKKSQSIAYHFVREGIARGEWMTTCINPMTIVTLWNQVETIGLFYVCYYASMPLLVMCVFLLDMAGACLFQPPMLSQHAILVASLSIVLFIAH